MKKMKGKTRRNIAASLIFVLLIAFVIFTGQFPLPVDPDAPTAVTAIHPISGMNYSQEEVHRVLRERADKVVEQLLENDAGLPQR